MCFLLLIRQWSLGFDGLCCCPAKQPKPRPRPGGGGTWILHANQPHLPTELCSPGGRFQLQEMVIGSEGSGKSRSCLALKVPGLSWPWVFPIGWKSSPSAKRLWVGAFRWLNWFGFWTVIQVGVFLGMKVTYLSSFPPQVFMGAWAVLMWISSGRSLMKTLRFSA